MDGARRGVEPDRTGAPRDRTRPADNPETPRLRDPHRGEPRAPCRPRDPGTPAVLETALDDGLDPANVPGAGGGTLLEKIQTLAATATPRTVAAAGERLSELLDRLGGGPGGRSGAAPAPARRDAIAAVYDGATDAFSERLAAERTEPGELDQALRALAARPGTDTPATLAAATAWLEAGASAELPDRSGENAVGHAARNARASLLATLASYPGVNPLAALDGPGDDPRRAETLDAACPMHLRATGEPGENPALRAIARG